MKFLRWAAGFLEQHTPQSMTRLCALLLCLAAVTVAWRSPGEHLTISALVVGGVVGLLVRKSNPCTPTP